MDTEHAQYAMDSSAILSSAAALGDVDVVHALIPATNQKAHNKALAWAAYKGKAACVKILIAVSDPKNNHSEALRAATKNAHADCVDLLYPVSDPQQALKIMQKEHPAYPEVWQALAQRVAAEEQHKMLTQTTPNIHSSHCTTARAKM